MKINKLILKNIPYPVQIKQTDSSQNSFRTTVLRSRTDNDIMVIEPGLVANKKPKETYTIYVSKDLKQLEIQYCTDVKVITDIHVDYIGIHLNENQHFALTSSLYCSENCNIHLTDTAQIDIGIANLNHLVVTLLNRTRLNIGGGFMMTELLSLNTHALYTNHAQIEPGKSIISTHKITTQKAQRRADYLKYETPYIDQGILYYGDIQTSIPKDGLDTFLANVPLSLSDDKNFIYLNAYEYDLSKQRWEFRYSLSRTMRNMKKDIVITTVSIFVGILTIKELFKKKNQEE